VHFVHRGFFSSKGLLAMTVLSQRCDIGGEFRRALKAKLLRLNSSSACAFPYIYHAKLWMTNAIV
jgi:hypothetical protein